MNIRQANQANQSTLDPDVESLRQVARSVYERNAELLKLDKMKDEFVAIVSHELRTPLTIIKNYLWLVVNREKDQVGAEPLKKIQIAIQSVDRLMALVEDTLTVSRIENNKISLTKVRFDLVERLEYILEVYSVHSQEKNLKIEFEKHIEKAEVDGDVNRLHEVIVNLLGNALKFSPVGGKIIVRIALSEDKKYVEVSVSDSGPGIPEDKQSMLFTKFGKIDESYTNLPNVNGTGLGLYISQQIMTLHGGTLTAKSEYGHGATFTLSLPL